MVGSATVVGNMVVKTSKISQSLIPTPILFLHLFHVLPSGYSTTNVMNILARQTETNATSA
jgi:hypothetical protein